MTETSVWAGPIPDSIDESTIVNTAMSLIK